MGSVQAHSRDAGDANTSATGTPSGGFHPHGPREVRGQPWDETRLASARRGYFGAAGASVTRPLPRSPDAARENASSGDTPDLARVLGVDDIEIDSVRIAELAL